MTQARFGSTRGILFGHPGGNPNSHQAALSHFERGRLAAFCVPWLPTPRQLAMLRRLPRMGEWVARVSRRCFPPLLDAPRIEGKRQEWARMLRRLIDRSGDHERLAYEANDWLMKTMRDAARSPTVTAVHSYEDCSLLSFEEAKRLGKPRIYDMPIGYYPAWVETQGRLEKEYADWLPEGTTSLSRWARPEQKVREMELADVVLTACSFAARTIQKHVDKRVCIARYGVDFEQWRPADRAAERASGPLRFVYAGHISVRKGSPLLIDCWRKAALKDAKLVLLGSWRLAQRVRDQLPPGVEYAGHCSHAELLRQYQQSDVFVFPSYFEGFGLVVGEALACGLPALVSDASVGADVIDDSCGMVFPAGDADALVECLRAVAARREKLAEWKLAARAKAETLTWDRYRADVADAVTSIGL